MKKTLLFTLLALLGMTQAVAQEYEYVPFVREGVKWVYSITDYHYEQDYMTNPAIGNNLIYRTLEIRGDTVINGKTYKAVHKYSGDAINEENDTIPVFLREEDKIVYGITNGNYYDDCQVGNYSSDSSEYYEALTSGQEFILYDFQDAITYWHETTFMGLNLHADTIVVGNHLAKRYLAAEEGPSPSFQVIEGIGAMGMNSYPLAFFMPVCTGMHCTEYYNLEKVVENGEVIYPQDYVEDRYMPLIREGVKWVNERVTVNHGDTTCCYYTYEFKGNHPETFSYGLTCKALYRYDGVDHILDVDKDSIVAAMREGDAAVLCYLNEPYSNICNQDRNLINLWIGRDFGIFYEMAGYQGELWCKGYYIDYQREQFLNEDNFIKVDPIMIGGYRCSRLAYINEQGDTLAYVVEGIGFDSRDLGDLLTPFTRKPDPDADYQEWCGLSHVVKDGQIIYKGMRYREDDYNGIDEVEAGRSARHYDGTYYNLMGQPVGKDVPTTPGIYIHNGKKIVVQ